MAWRKPASLRDWARIILRHRKKLLFPALAVMTLVVIASHQLPREYRASATFRRTSSAAAEQIGANIIGRELRPIRRTSADDIKGQEAIRQLILDVEELNRGLPHDERGDIPPYVLAETIEKLRERITIRYQTQSDQVDDIIVSFTDPNPELPPKVVNKLVLNYISRTRQSLTGNLRNSKSFFEQQVSGALDALRSLERKKLDFEMANPGLLPEDPSSVTSKLAELRTQFAAKVQEFEVTESKRKALEDWAKQQPETVKTVISGKNPELQLLETQKVDLEKQLDNELTIMGRTEEHPQVRKLRQRLVLLQGKIDEAAKEVPLTTEERPNDNLIKALQEIKGLEGMVEALGRQRDELAAKVAQHEDLSQNFINKRAEFERLKRDLAQAQEQATFWEDKLRRMQIAVSTDVSEHGLRFEVIDMATVLEKHMPLPRPAKPAFLAVLGAALALGLATGAAAVILAELLDHSFRSIDQAVDELKLPVLGAVSEIITPARARRHKVLGWGVYPALSVAMVLVLAVSFLLAYLSIENPQGYKEFRENPRRFLSDTLHGR